MTDPGDQKEDHPRAASPKQLTRASLDHQAENICMNAIQKSISEALMTMELQLRSLAALPLKPQEPFLNLGCLKVQVSKPLSSFHQTNSLVALRLMSSTGFSRCSFSLPPAPNFSAFLAAFALL